MKLTDWLTNKIHISTFLHFALSGWFVQFGLYFGWLYGLIFAAVIILLGLVKELFLDAKFDVYDLIADIAGPIVAFALYGLYVLII